MGDVVLRDQPFCIAVHDSAISSVCARCLGACGALVRCCQWASFCESCFPLKAEVHTEPQCKILSRLSPENEGDTSDLRAATLALLCGDKSGLWDLDTNEGGMRSMIPEAYEDCQYYSGVVAALTGCGEAEALGALMRVRTNGFGVKCSSPERRHWTVARGVYLAASRFNHSCSPNASAVRFEGRDIVVRALADIPEGEEVTVAYTYDLYQGAAARRAAIAQEFGFLCQCARCEPPAGAAGSDEQVIMGVLCPVCSGGDPASAKRMDPEGAERQEDSVFVCAGCGARRKAVDVERYLAMANAAGNSASSPEALEESLLEPFLPVFGKLHVLFYTAYLPLLSHYNALIDRTARARTLCRDLIECMETVLLRGREDRRYYASWAAPEAPGTYVAPVRSRGLAVGSSKRLLLDMENLSELYRIEASLLGRSGGSPEQVKEAFRRAAMLLWVVNGPSPEVDALLAGE